MQYIVIKRPKSRFGGSLHTLVVVVSAESKAGALRASNEVPNFTTDHERDYSKATVEELQEWNLYYL